MDALRHQRVKQVFEAVSQLPSEQWPSLLDEHCFDDPDLRGEVESLLKHVESPAVDFELAAADVKAFFTSTGAHSKRTIERIKDFRVLGVLGEGGMGVVYLAEQDMPRRQIALKIIKPGHVSAELLRRFEHEAQVLGRLQHPGIAQIFEAGSADAGYGRQPYFAMEYVRGRSLLQHAQACKLTTRDRLALLVKICDAVHHAHEQGIIHRDLKPANILVVEESTLAMTATGARSVGQPKILDFGVARSTNSDVQATTLRTDIGQLIGTIPYMSPEQVTGDSKLLDARSDVYALGVIGYELLTGHLPHDLRGKTIPEAIRTIQEHGPRSLSSHSRYFRGDLETIFSKALEKEPARRYATAADLAADMTRYLEHHPIEARPPTLLYHCKQFAKRHRAFVGASAAVFLMLVIAVIAISIYAVRAIDARDEAVHVQGLLTIKTGEAEQEADRAKRQAYRANIATADAALHVNDMSTAQACLREVDEASRSNWEWRYYASQMDDSVGEFPGSGTALYGLSISSDSRMIAVAGWDKTVSIWDRESGKRLVQIKGHEKPANSAELSPDGSSVASSSQDRTLRIWDAQSGQQRLAIEDFNDEVIDAVFSPDGATIVSACGDGSVRLIDAVAGTTRWETKPHNATVYKVCISADGSRIATASADGSAKILNAIDGSERGAVHGHRGLVRSTALSPDGKQLATGGDDLTVRLWNVHDLTPIAVLRGHTAMVNSLAYSPDSRYLASASKDSSIRIWDAVNLEEACALTGHALPINGIDWSNDGEFLATGGTDGNVRLWDAAVLEDPDVLKGHENQVRGLGFSVDGKLLFSASPDGTMRAWDVATGYQVAKHQSFEQSTSPLAVSPSRDCIAIVGPDHSVLLRDSQGDLLLDPLAGHTNLVSALAFSHDGEILASGSADATVRLWNARTGALVRVLDGHAASRICGIAFLCDGQIVTASHDRMINIWNADGTLIRSFDSKGRLLMTIAISPDETVLAAGNGDGAVRFFGLTDGAQVGQLLEGTSGVQALAFSPDGARLASGDFDGSVRVWDTQTCERVAVLHGHVHPILSMAFSPDGSILVTGSDDKTIRIWETQPIAKRLNARRTAKGD